MNEMKTFTCLLLAALTLPASLSAAEEIGCATTTWKLIGANHRV
jgi:CreA protein